MVGDRWGGKVDVGAEGIRRVQDVVLGAFRGGDRGAGIDARAEGTKRVRDVAVRVRGRRSLRCSGR